MLSTLIVGPLRPSAARFQAASKRSSASPAPPTRSSSSLGGDVLLEVIAQLLHGAELVGPRAPAHAAPAVLVLDELAVAQPVAEIVVQLDLEQHAVEQHLFLEDHHMA